MTAARPLAATTVLITRPRSADSPLGRRLRTAGARVLWQPAIEIRETAHPGPIDDAIRRLDEFEWVVFTSAHGVASFASRVSASRIAPKRVGRKRIAVVGPATAAAAGRLGWPAAVVAQPHSAEGLVAIMRSWLTRSTAVLYPHAAGARPVLAEGLRNLGARVTEVLAYATVPSPSSRAATGVLDEDVDCVTFCSPSAIAALSPHHPRLATRTIACIGPTTAAAARAAGLPVQIVPGRATGLALANAIVDYYRGAGR